MREGTAYSYKQTKGQRPGGGRCPYQTVKKTCHCEPVRAAKQVPLGYRLARQFVSKTHNSCTFPKIPN